MHRDAFDGCVIHTRTLSTPTKQLNLNTNDALSTAHVDLGHRVSNQQHSGSTLQGRNGGIVRGWSTLRNLYASFSTKTLRRRIGMAKGLLPTRYDGISRVRICAVVCFTITHGLPTGISSRPPNGNDGASNKPDFTSHFNFDPIYQIPLHYSDPILNA